MDAGFSKDPPNPNRVNMDGSGMNLYMSLQGDLKEAHGQAT